MHWVYVFGISNVTVPYYVVIGESRRMLLYTIAINKIISPTNEITFFSGNKQ